MIIMIWLGIGAIVGWVACLTTNTRGRANCVLNVTAGAGGSLVAGLLTNLAGTVVGITGGGLMIASLFVCFGFSWVLLTMVSWFQPVFFVEQIHYRPRSRRVWG